MPGGLKANIEVHAVPLEGPGFDLGESGVLLSPGEGGVGGGCHGSPFSARRRTASEIGNGHRARSSLDPRREPFGT